MAEGKWITALRPGTPVADAARRVLGIRLGIVRDYLGLALREPEKDPEYVHQLRVGTRRSGAALRMFAGSLPDKVFREARKQLRRLRRAAGEARDWDVFLESLKAHHHQHPARHRAGIDFLTGYATAHRVAAQSHLHEASPDYPYAYERLLADVLAGVGEPAPGPHMLRDLAPPMFSGLLETLDQAAAADLQDYANLHQVRIAGKRLRYAMEVLVDCFAPAFRHEFYPAVEEMQEILGRANDSHVAGGRLAALRDYLKAARPADWKRYKTGIEGLLTYHQRRLPEERQHFEEWWKHWRRLGGQSAMLALLKPGPRRAGHVSGAAHER
jgi:CHAD domain-containing protein